MLVSAVSSLLGEENGQGETDQTHRPTTKASPTHRPPTLHHTTLKSGRERKADMFPQTASTMRQTEISPLPPACPDHPPPCLPATFRLAFRPSKGHSPTTGCSALGKIWFLMTRLANREVCPVTWKSMLAGTGLSNTTSRRSMPAGRW